MKVIVGRSEELRQAVRETGYEVIAAPGSGSAGAGLQELAELCREADVALSVNLPREVMALAPKLRGIVTTSIGTERIDVDGATELAATALGIDVKLVTAGGGGGSRNAAADAEQIYAPGSILRVMVDPAHPVGKGMAEASAIYFVNSTSLDLPAGSKARVIARYPSQPDSILLSGFLQGASTLAGKVAAADVPLGSGRVTMFGFRPLYRGQSYGTFKMFFNALLEPGTARPVQ